MKKDIPHLEQSLEIAYVEHMDEVLTKVLEKNPFVPATSAKKKRRTKK